ncbi:MAG TPA: M1 family metallopeptidase [Bacteroidales bacterium]|nr:M1 family metallopeptidase [Bacteroidales bacterium]
MSRLRIFFSLLMMLVEVTKTASQDNEYFQQEVNTVIHTSLDVNSNELHSWIRIEYINNSPDTLDFLYFHLWPNAYSSNSTDLARQLFSLNGRQKLFKDEKKRGFIDSVSFISDGSSADAEYIKPDICRVILPFPLPPGDTVNIETPFRVKLPGANISRMGAYDGIFQVSQWYPKPAVYDKEGWHPMPYLDQGEFYSEFGSYDVYITVPANFVVGASGELVTKPELQWLENYASSWQPGQFTAETATGMKTLHFTAGHIHDFAWVAGSGFRMERDSIILPGSGRTVITQVMYAPSGAALWSNAMEFVKRSLLQFSEWIGDYPYDVYTAIQAPLAAGAGMEYPGMAVIGDADDEYSLDEVITHEVCHSWFYSAIGSDERRYPFMDESLASAMEERYMQKYYPGKKLWEVFLKNERLARFFGISRMAVERMDELDWLIPAYQNIEQPFNLPADRYTEANYNSMIYNKAAKSFNFLRSYLGDAAYDSVMYNYFMTWNGRHPGPEDLQKAFEMTGKKIDWFFTDFLTTVKRTDYSMKKLKDNVLTVKNNGETAPPFRITAKGQSGMVSFWVEGFSGRKEIKIPVNDYEEVYINYDHRMPEINLPDNNIRKTGLLKRFDRVRPEFLFTIYDPGERPLFFLPLVNWNRADGVMAGFNINNGIIISRKFEYSLMPFLTFKDPGFSGRGMIRYTYLPYNAAIRKMSLTLEGSSFGFYKCINYTYFRSSIDLFFRERNMTNAVSKQLNLNFINTSDITRLEPGQEAGSKSFITGSFSAGKQSLVNPWNIRLSAEGGSTFGKILFQVNYRLSYYGSDNGLDLRFLTGGMIKSDPSVPMYSMAPSSRNGSQLYLFEGDFPDRFSKDGSSFWSRQILTREGGITTAINDSSGYSPFLVSISAKTTMPFIGSRLPVRPFANIVYQSKASENFHWEAGLSAGIPGFLEFFIPLLASRDINSYYPHVKDRIRFILTLESFYKLRPSV